MLVTDGLTVRAGRRSALLDEKSSFHNFQRILKNITPAVLDVFHRIEKDGELIKSVDGGKLTGVTVFGELYGGKTVHQLIRSMSIYQSINESLESRHDLFLNYMLIDFIVGISTDEGTNSRGLQFSLSLSKRLYSSSSS